VTSECGREECEAEATQYQDWIDGRWQGVCWDHLPEGCTATPDHRAKSSQEPPDQNLTTLEGEDVE
jgi:hypothetical protein